MAASGGRPASGREASASRSRALASSGAGQRGQGLGGSLAVEAAAAQAVLFDLEAGVLVGVLDGRGVDLVQLVAEQVDLAGPLPGVTAQGCRVSSAQPAHVGRADSRGAQVDVAEGVEGAALGIGVDQGPVLVLAVQFDQPGG